MPPRFLWLALALVSSAFAATPRSGATVSADDRERYALEVESMWKSIELTPIQMDRVLLLPGDVVRPFCSVVNTSGASVAVPPMPGAKSGETLCMLAYVEWTIRRLDGKALTCTGPGYGSAVVDRKSFCLFRGMIYFRNPDRMIVPGLSQLVPAWEVDVIKHDLASGEYELALNCSVPDAGWRRLVAKQAIIFNVDNSPAGRAAATQRRVVSGLLQGSVKLGDLVLSDSSVARGGSLEAEVKLINATPAAITLPVDNLRGAPFTQKWYLTRFPYSGYRNTLSCRSFMGGTKDESGKLVLDPGVFGVASEKPSTDKLEPGTYEIAVELLDASGAQLGTRMRKFDVTK